ncbi:HAD family hydrolase [Allobacillus sp. SKP2-8]|uniref:HAD family hydrolase n=1 Tax=unclassified Allobacillus TaxID=2628859 RepID=UPI001182312C|nr:HAD family hydrolase [Allobacillus sp. SKP2-8]TSJ66918.1 HAD family hydrolase [Allobacillus sp. SKP2-8]
MYRNIIEQADVVIFDLDGTLYEGKGHFKLHTENLKSRVREDLQEAFQEKYNQYENGESPLQIGKIYDGERDLIWSWDPFQETLTEARNWENEVVEVENAPSYMQASDFDFDQWVPIGDGWWPPYAVARHFGVTVEEIKESYDQTKVQMAELEGFLNHTPGLKEYLEELSKRKTLLVCTNSDLEDAKRLLSFLELEQFFVEVIPSALKPVNTKKHFNYVIEKYNVDAEKLVSVGDNFMNEIAPALQLGMNTVWITDVEEAPVDDDRLILTNTLATFE